MRHKRTCNIAYLFIEWKSFYSFKSFELTIFMIFVIINAWQWALYLEAKHEQSAF